MAPVLRTYQILLYPLAKPCAKLLDLWLGAEGIYVYREQDFREVIQRHIDSEGSAIDRVEGLGALNFLALDDIPVDGEGEEVDPLSIVALPTANGFPEFPPFDHDPSDPFLRKIEASGKRWVVVTDLANSPLVVLDADGFLRAAVFDAEPTDPRHYCHRPIIVERAGALLGSVLPKLKMRGPKPSADVIDEDVILSWGAKPRIVTGSDVLGRLLSGIASGGSSTTP